MRFREGHEDRIPAWALRTLAAQCGISPRTLQRWVRAHLDDLPSTEHRRFEISREHLVAVRATLNLREAHKSLWPTRATEGWVSYPTFARAFSALPSGIRDGVLGGIDGMAASHVYLSMAAPHANHTWHLDHTQADVWVNMGRGQIARPWVSMCRDSSTSVRLCAVAYEGRPNEDSLCDLLATAAQGHRYDTPDGPIEIGGTPVQIVLDNGAEHFAEAVTRGAALLGSVVAPTKAYAKHQNGQAESGFSALNKQLLAHLPGYTKGGLNESGRTALTPDLPDKIDPSTVLTFEAFQTEIDKYVHEQNTTTKIHRLGGMTPLQAWAADPTERVPVTEATVRAMMLRHSTAHAVNAEGIRFRGRDYLAFELNSYRTKGLRLTIGYLSRETRFIEVFDGADWICRAYDRDLLSVGQRQQVLAARQRDIALINEINAQAIQQRRHMLASTDAEAYDESTTDVEAEGATEAAVDEALSTDASNVVTMHAEQDTDGVTDMPRQDPTTPRLSKRQRARSTAEQTDIRDEERDQKRLDRLLAKRGFGGIGGAQTNDEGDGDDPTF